MPNTIKILTIDDEDAVQSIIIAFLNRFLSEFNFSCEIKAFSDPIQGVFELSSHGEQYKVILLDVRLPKLTGDEIFNSLLHTNPELVNRVIFITGYPNDLINRFPDMKLNILNKPFRYKNFCEKIADVLRQK
ncbi:MAG TPA: response regulator [Ghiorsea sp.]|nr:response regulator [Ghiorsea sp.]HIP07384.1 response regulator [Mariprofundaceae bacterium]